ncbi:MAG TPA: ABC transporter permease, partial [Limnochordia bacterium]
ALARKGKLTVGLALLFALVVPAIVGGWAIPDALHRTGAFTARLPPGAGGLLGTDALGRSVAVQFTEALPNSLQVGLIAATIGTLLGAAVGFVSGYFGRWVDALLRVLIDVFLAVPSLLFLILLASLLKGVGVVWMALIIGLFAWAWPARQIRAQVLSLKERPFVQVARLSGMSDLEIIARELLPHMFPWLGANFVNAALSAILAESGLSLLGLGPQQEATLGMMIYWALSYSALFQGLWWWWVTPVLALTLIFLALYLIHLGLDEMANPRARPAG